MFPLTAGPAVHLYFSTNPAYLDSLLSKVPESSIADCTYQMFSTESCLSCCAAEYSNWCYYYLLNYLK
ncbi:hypothetical protein EB796_008975 [Bugula neritina]|uniref:Uncharacterized protein n=1 Tax=Bugula neritina TaxID=10212 RepID=A0A7J7K3C2_BUGNE|nr:hypothetical protein EB796_008975 [Bugula neritina]